MLLRLNKGKIWDNRENFARVAGLEPDEFSWPPVRIDSLDFTEEKIFSLVASVGLFGGFSVVLLEDLGEGIELSDFVLKNIKLLQASPNIFVFSSTKPLLVFNKKLDSLKIKSISGEAHLEIVKKTSKNGLFELTDVFGQRDKLRSWLIFYQLLKVGFSADEINNVLFWQVKNMALAKENKSWSENLDKIGLKSFPFRKALSFRKNFSEEELRKMSSRLTEILQLSRAGVADHPVALERFILSL